MLPLKQVFLPPSIRFSHIVYHYEWYEIEDLKDERFPFYPSLTTGFLFLFYFDKPITIQSKSIKKEKLPRMAMLPPSVLPTVNINMQHVKILRVILRPGVISNLFHVNMKEFQDKLIMLEQDLDPELGNLYERF
ncbi:MAG: hypothetical protein AAFY71_14680 [Bacteroidota bacterium]